MAKTAHKATTQEGSIQRKGIPTALFLVIYVMITTGFPTLWHYQRHGIFSLTQSGLAFFLGMNSIVCVWEILLFFKIDYIEKRYLVCKEQYKSNKLAIAGDFFSRDVHFGNVFSPTLWAEIWITYSVFDPSYASRQSFGFFIDVGNGFTTFLPTIIFLVGMTAHGPGGYVLPISPRTLGLIGFTSLYQQFYGTVVYFSSFILNKRHQSLTLAEISFLVIITNGLWLFFPLLGMAASWNLIQNESFSSFL